MLAVSNGDLQQLSVLFQRYNKMIYNYYLRKSGSIELSQDLTQTVFERILKYKDTFKKDYNFKSWIYRIASNVYMDHFRDNKLKTSELKANMDRESSSVVDSTDNSQYSRILKAMKTLSDTDQEIIQLTKIENLKIKEVAKILDLSESAVKVKVHRSIKRLKNIVFNQK